MSSSPSARTLGERLSAHRYRIQSRGPHQFREAPSFESFLRFAAFSRPAIPPCIRGHTGFHRTRLKPVFYRVAMSFVDSWLAPFPDAPAARAPRFRSIASYRATSDLERRKGREIR